MEADQELAVGLIQALLENARDLAADARLLLEHDRHARCFALAALAGEELGKVAICLDWIFGDSSSSLKETRQAWQSHGDKLASLVAYRAAFIDDPATLRPGSLRGEAQRLASRKMDAIYVDFKGGRIASPARLSRAEARALLGQVEDAIAHATENLSQLSPGIASAIGEVAPHLVGPLSTYIDSLSPDQAAEALRRVVSDARELTDQDWADAFQSNRVAELLSIEPVDPPALVREP